MRCLTCGFDNLPEMKFCGQCGVRLGQVCSTCGFVNPPDHRFCGQCGTPLSEEPILGRDPGSGRPMAPLTRTEASVTPNGTTIPLEGERRLATVILADVVGSTGILERIGSEAWVHMMNRVLQILEAQVYRFGGVVDQFRGDGLVAFFGIRSAHEDDPERAVLAALAMHKAIEPCAEELAAKAGMLLALRVGVNTGQVIVASIGDRRHYSEDTAMGEAITLAARMERAAEPGTVLVSGNTYHLVEPQFDWEPLGTMTIRGIKRPVPIYRPLKPCAGVTRVRRLQTHELSAWLIGREAEIETLNEKVDELRAGRGGIVMVIGDKGMGKSSLIASAHQHAVRDDAVLAKASGLEPRLGTASPRTVTWLHGRCRSYAHSAPYSVWLDMLGEWLGVREAEPAIQTRDRLRHQAEALWGDRSAAHYPYLASLLSLPLEDTLAQQVDTLDAESRRQQYSMSVRSWVEALARRRPLVLIFEDIHWADTTSLELLEYCLPLYDRAPVLWLPVFRPDRASPACEFQHRVRTEHPHRLTSLTLSSLTEAQGSKMIDRLIGHETLPAHTRELLLDRAEGNPYCIGEFIHALIREGVLARDAETDEWHATRQVDSLDLPDSLHAMLLARIDRLSPDERRVLQMAAVIGAVFWSNVLHALVCNDMSIEVGAVEEHLQALQRAQLIHEHSGVSYLGVEYIFDSNLIRSAAYESLLSVKRVSCHGQVADVLESIFGEEVLGNYFSLLAYHYQQAGATRKELFYTLLAAEKALQFYANVEALEYFTRALELLDEIEAGAQNAAQLYAIRTQRFEVLNGRRGVFFLLGDVQAAWADARALLPLAMQLPDDPVWLIDALLEQPGVAGWRTSDELSAGVPMAQEALALVQQLGDRRREMRTQAAIASQRFHLNDPAWKEAVDRSLELARQTGDQRFEIALLTRVGHAYALSDPEQSRQYLETGLSISQSLADKGAELELLELQGAVLENTADYYRRLKDCHEAQLRISSEIGNRPAKARALMFCGQIRALYLGDHDGGLALLEECLGIWQGMPQELYPLLRKVQIYVARGDYAEALAAHERARRIGKAHTHDIGLIGLDLVSAILYTALRDETHLRMALDLAKRNREAFVQNPELSQQYQMVAACEEAAAHLELAEVLAPESGRALAQERENHLREALESSQAAVQLYQAFRFVRPIECVSEEILYRHSRVLGANGYPTEAADYLRRAHDEMMRKHALIPAESRFRDSFLENIPLHREIRAAFARDA